jgi:polyhydroxyalkanoate synthesis regulator phasin
LAKDKDKTKRKQSSRADAVRAAVDQAFQAAPVQVSRDRAQELLDELTTAAGKVRDALDDLRPPTGEDIRDLRARLEALEKRVAKLEQPTPARRGRATTPGASRQAPRKSS